MRINGINYDTGMAPAGRSSRPIFNHDEVRRDMTLIAQELHCDAVRTVLFDTADVDAAFWFTFASFDKPRRADPSRDLDLASFGVVAVDDRARDGVVRPLQLKESFAALAEFKRSS